MENNTIFAVYNDTKRKLEAAGVEDFGFEARVIMRHLTGFDNKKIMLNYNMPLNEFQLKRISEIVTARTAKYPLQYILGTWNFYGYDFYVGDGVLIPRADTETLVDTALELIKDKENPEVLDLCAGSGAVGISIALKRPDSRCTLVEKYDKAAEFLKKNIKLNGADNAKFVSGDVLKGDGNEKEFDLIVSNPPYIKSEELGGLQAEVKYEPQTALDGGIDGLIFYRAIADNYKCAIKKGGSICFEAGVDQSESIAEILRKTGYKNIDTRKDLSGIDRVVFGTVE